MQAESDGTVNPFDYLQNGPEWRDWLIPLGLSYYAFRQIHVAFECYKQLLRPPTIKSYAGYLVFLPVMLIGPIHRMPDFERSLRRMKWNATTCSEGMERILYGLVKINFPGNFLFSLELPQYAKSLSPLSSFIAKQWPSPPTPIFSLQAFRIWLSARRPLAGKTMGVSPVCLQLHTHRR